MRVPSRVSAALSLVVALVACGGSAPDLGLSGPDATSLIWGDTATLALNLERGGDAVGAVTLGVEGLPEGVTARFEPGTLAGDVLTSTLHLEAARDASKARAQVTVRATGPKASVAEHTFELDVGGLTVTGSVHPLGGTRVSSSLQVKVGSEWVATDGEGGFTAENVAVPYDLALVGPAFTEVYPGLRTASPRVEGFVDDPTASYEGTTITGTLDPAPLRGERVTVCASAGSVFASRCTSMFGTGVQDTFYLYLPLVGASTEPIRIVARREGWEDHLSTGFTGYGEALLPENPGVSVALDLALEPSMSTAVPLTFETGSLPLADVLGRVTYGAYLNRRDNLRAGEAGAAPGHLHLPEGGEGVIVAVLEQADGSDSITRQPVTGPLAAPIGFATPLPVISPSEGDTLTEATGFLTAVPPGHLVSHTFHLTDGRVVTLHTFEDRVHFTALRAVLPDLSPAEVASWIVVSSPGVTSIEQALEQPVGLLNLLHVMDPRDAMAPSRVPVQMHVSTIGFATAGSTANDASLMERVRALMSE